MDFFSFGSRKGAQPNTALDEDELGFVDPPSASKPPAASLQNPMAIRTPTSAQRSRTPSRNNPLAGSSQSQSQDRLQIVLDPSPRKALNAYHTVPDMPDMPDMPEDEAENSLVGSDLRKQHRTPGRPPATSVPCGATQPASPAVGQAPQRKIGRPKGSKNLTPAEKLARLALKARNREQRAGLKARAAAVAGGQQQPPKKRGRPAKNPAESPAQTFRRLTPSFLPFGCEWEGCPAELQNMATLRRHVAIVHQRSEVCLWGKCAKKATSKPMVTEDEFISHMEKAHLIPYQWHMGDGHKNTSPRDGSGGQDNKKAIPAYLCDRDGNQVTPSIEDQEIEDFATWRKRRQQLKEYFIQRDENIPFEEESEDDDGDLPVA